MVRTIVAIMAKLADSHPDEQNDPAPDRKYLSFLCHDLSNNLNAICIHLELLQERLSGSGDFIEEACVLDRLRQSIGHTAAGMKRMLAQEQFRKQHARAHAERVNLQMLAHDVRAQYYVQARAKGLDISVDVSRDLFIHSDASLIAVVLQNLVGNSVKYSDRGTVRIAARNDPAPFKGGCKLSVSDAGPGIPPRYIGNIFNAFQRGDAGSHEGVGLGLAIASEAAGLLGATLSVESQAGEGSTFSLKLPTHSPAADDGRPFARRRRGRVQTNAS